MLDYNPAAPSKFIYSGSKHIQEAKDYFTYLTKPENLQFTVDEERIKQSLRKIQHGQTNIL